MFGLVCVRRVCGPRAGAHSSPARVSTFLKPAHHSPESSAERVVARSQGDRNMVTWLSPPRVRSACSRGTRADSAAREVRVPDPRCVHASPTYNSARDTCYHAVPVAHALRNAHHSDPACKAVPYRVVYVERCHTCMHMAHGPRMLTTRTPTRHRLTHSDPLDPRISLQLDGGNGACSEWQYGS